MAHVNLGKQHPAAYKSVLALNEEVEEAVARAGLDAKLAELVKVRMSQLTGCAFCLRMHTRRARQGRDHRSSRGPCRMVGVAVLHRT